MRFKVYNVGFQLKPHDHVFKPLMDTSIFDVRGHDWKGLLPF